MNVAGRKAVPRYPRVFITLLSSRAASAICVEITWAVTLKTLSRRLWLAWALCQRVRRATPAFRRRYTTCLFMTLTAAVLTLPGFPSCVTDGGIRFSSMNKLCASSMFVATVSIVSSISVAWIV